MSFHQTLKGRLEVQRGPRQGPRSHRPPGSCAPRSSPPAPVPTPPGPPPLSCHITIRRRRCSRLVCMSPASSPQRGTPWSTHGGDPGAWTDARDRGAAQHIPAERSGRSGAGCLGHGSGLRLQWQVASDRRGLLAVSGPWWARGWGGDTAFTDGSRRSGSWLSAGPGPAGSAESGGVRSELEGCIGAPGGALALLALCWGAVEEGVCLAACSPVTMAPTGQGTRSPPAPARVPSLPELP